MSSIGEDIASIRKKEKLSIQDIFDATRIPQDILKEIENGNIFKDPKRNKTYVRSFVRTYAKALKIDENDIIEALDETYKGTYSGSVAEKYGIPQKREKREQSEKDDLKDQGPYKPKFRLEDTQKKEQTPQKESETPPEKEPVPEETETVPESAKPASDSKKDIPPSDSPKFNDVSRPDPNKEHNKLTPEPPTVDKVNWVDMGKKVYATGNRSLAPIISTIVAVILIISTYYIYVHFISGGNNLHKNKGQSLAVDSVATVPVTSPSDTSAQASKPVNLITATSPDTLHLTIYAAYGNLSPVRVESDVITHLNPYWIAKGQAMRFEFTRQIAIHGKFSLMLLLMNGHLITDQNKYLGPDNMIHLTRSMFENNPKWVSPPADTLQNGVPQPKVVKNRPIFP